MVRRRARQCKSGCGRSRSSSPKPSGAIQSVYGLISCEPPTLKDMIRVWGRSVALILAAGRTGDSSAWSGVVLTMDGSLFLVIPAGRFALGRDSSCRGRITPVCASGRHSRPPPTLRWSGCVDGRWSRCFKTSNSSAGIQRASCCGKQKGDRRVLWSPPRSVPASPRLSKNMGSKNMGTQSVFHGMVSQRNNSSAIILHPGTAGSASAAWPRRKSVGWVGSSFVYFRTTSSLSRSTSQTTSVPAAK